MKKKTKVIKKRMQIDRLQSIFKMHKLGYTNRYIAQRNKCSASTVSDTLNLYKHPKWDVWQAMSCYEKAHYVFDKQKAAARNKKRFSGALCSLEKREYVDDKLINDEWSPEIISNKMQESIGESVGVSTIYRYVKKSGARLRKHLYERGKRRRQRVANRRGRFKKKEHIVKKYISERPKIINSRKEFGHWEGDLIVGPKNGSGYVILSLIERKTRLKKFIRMPNAKADTTLSYLKAFFMQLPQYARKSITFDNGSEFVPSQMHKLEEQQFGMTVYYTQPYSPEQKGSDEHSNGRFRRRFPKKTDFLFAPKTDISQENAKLNNRPMKLHRFKSPQEMFNREMEATAVVTLVA